MLMTGRWQGGLSTPDKLADRGFMDPESVGLRWNVEYFGLQRLEVRVKAGNRYDAYDRTSNHHGGRIAAYSHWSRRPVSGFITSVEDAGARRVQYVAEGPAATYMMADLVTTIFSPTSDVDGALTTILTGMSSRVDNADFSQVANNATALGGWQPPHPQGAYPTPLIQELLKKPDSGGNIWDFWLVDEPFLNTKLQKWQPYYQYRNPAGSPNWIVSLKDLSSLTLARNIKNLQTDVTVFYGVITGTANGGSTQTVTRASGSWLTEGVKPGDTITKTNGTQGQARITDVQATTLTFNTLSHGASFGSGDSWAIERQEPKDFVNLSVTPAYWAHEVIAFEPAMNQTQATYYADMLRNTEPEQLQAVTITAPRIRRGDGSFWPLWETIIQAGGYLWIRDLYPATADLGNSLNRRSTFFITTLDYDHTSNALRVGLDTPDRRLDARLRRAGLVGSELVGRQEAAYG